LRSCLLEQLSGFESRHLSIIENGCNMQRSGLSCNPTKNIPKWSCFLSHCLLIPPQRTEQSSNGGGDRHLSYPPALLTKHYCTAICLFSFPRGCPASFLFLSCIGKFIVHNPSKFYTLSQGKKYFLYHFLYP